MNESNKHEKYGGSTIELVGLCPGSAKARQELGEIPSSPAAARGTRIHERVELLLKSPINRTHELKEDEELIAQGVKTVLLEVVAEHGFTIDDLEVEKKVMLMPNAGGKLDYCAFKVFGDLLIIDLKTGFNQIQAENNIQMAFYACGYFNELDPFIRGTIENIHLIILQPDQEPPYEVKVRKHTLTQKDMFNYEADFNGIIGAAENNPNKRIPGTHCMEKFCPARATCIEYQNWLADQSDDAFTKVWSGILPPPARGTELACHLAAVPFIKDWCKAVEEDAKNVLLQDINAVPGWTLQDSLGNRAWIDEKQAMKEAKKIGLTADEYAPRDLIGPAPFERLLKKRKLELDLNPLVERPKTGVRLVEAKQESKTLEEVFS